MISTQCRHGTCTRENLQGEDQQQGTCIIQIMTLQLIRTVTTALLSGPSTIISVTQEIVPLCL